MICYLEIRSWVGQPLCFSAEHYYGTLVCNGGPNGDNLDPVDLEYTPTDGERARINRTETYKICHLQQGDKSKQFFTKDKLIEVALAEWRQHFPDADFLVEGDHIDCGPQPVLDGDVEVKEAVNAIIAELDEIGWYEGDKEGTERVMKRFHLLWDPYDSRLDGVGHWDDGVDYDKTDETEKTEESNMCDPYPDDWDDSCDDVWDDSWDDYFEDEWDEGDIQDILGDDLDDFDDDWDDLADLDDLDDLDFSLDGWDDEYEDWD